MKIIKFLFIILLIPKICFAGAASDFVPANDDRFNHGDVTNFDGLSALSVAVFFKLDASSTGRLITKWGDLASERSFLLERAFTDEIQFAVGDSSTLCAKYTSAANIGTGAWHYAVGVWSTSGNITIYIDGSSQGLTTNFCGAMTTIQNTSKNLEIGHETDESADAIDGQMAYAGIYKRALTAVDVAELRFKPESFQSDGLWALWDATTVTIKDLSGSNNNGTPAAASGGGPDEVSDGPPVMFGGGLPL